MITTALGLLAAIFGGLGVYLIQTNHPTLSNIFCFISVLLFLIALFTHRKETRSSVKSIPSLNSDNLEVSELHHPELREFEHSSCVLWCSVVNKSGHMVTINKVIAFDSADRLLPITWSNRISEVGNPLNPSGLIGIKETETLYLRHNHGTHFFYCKLELHHSLSDKPIIKIFDELAEDGDASLPLRSTKINHNNNRASLNLNKDQIAILVLLWDKKNLPDFSIAQETSLDIQSAKFHITEMSRLKLISASRLKNYHHDVWNIAHEGRRFLMSNNLRN